MRLRAVEYCDPALFCDAVLPSLLRREAEYCLHIGLVLRLALKRKAAMTADELYRPLLITIEDQDPVELIALQTLKSKMLVTHGSDPAMKLLAEHLADRNWRGEEIIGFPPSVHALAEYYAQRSGRTPRMALRLGIFQLTAVTWPAGVPGSMRLCAPGDRQLLAQFLGAFAAEIGEPSDEDDLARADRLIGEQRLFFWIDGQAVAMAGWSGRTPNGVRISSVYTPPEFRGRGYASNLVAHLTQRMLDSGRRFCFLNTDLSHPTSNNIYQKIGYWSVGECEIWKFGESTSA